MRPDHIPDEQDTVDQGWPRLDQALEEPESGVDTAEPQLDDEMLEDGLQELR